MLRSYVNITSTNSKAVNADSLQSILWPFRRLSWNCEMRFIPANCAFLKLILQKNAGHTFRVGFIEFDIGQNDAIFQFDNCFNDTGDR